MNMGRGIQKEPCGGNAYKKARVKLVYINFLGSVVNAGTSKLSVLKRPLVCRLARLQAAFSMNMVRGFFLVWWACMLGGIDSVIPSINDDTTCSLPEGQRPGMQADLRVKFQADLQVSIEKANPTFFDVWGSLRWFPAERHIDDLKQFMSETSGIVSQTWHCLDLFGASQRVKSMWESKGFNAVAYDIKLSPMHDICAEFGVKTLLTYALQQHA